MNAWWALRTLVGGLLLSAGALIALSCGLCTGWFGLEALTAKPSLGTDTWFYLGVGTVSTAIGVGLAWGGIALLRGR